MDSRIFGGWFRELTFNEVTQTLDGWLKVRHAIAHDNAKMPRNRVLEAIEARAKADVKAGKMPQVENYPAPTIRKSDAMAAHCGCESSGWRKWKWDE